MYETQTNIYIRQTGDQLNSRFNRHRSDIRCYPDYCEKDLKISILKKAKGSEAKGQYKEDQWKIRLDTSYPNGLNVHLLDFGCLFQLLFK